MTEITLTNTQLLMSIVRHCNRRVQEGTLPTTLQNPDDAFWKRFTGEHSNRLISLVTSAIDSGLLSGKYTLTPFKEGTVNFSIYIYGVTLKGLQFSKGVLL